MVLDHEMMLRLFSQLIWPMGRIGGVMLTVPVFSSPMIPARIRILFTMILCLVCSQFIPGHLSFVNFEGRYVVYLLQDFALGLLMGFSLLLVFQVFVLGGQIISMQAGLGFAVMMEPTSRASMPVISQMYLMLVTLVYLSLNGHLAFLDTLIESFDVIPVGSITNTQDVVGRVLLFSGWMFKEAVSVSLPAMMALLIVNLAFGIMARVAPQLNIFSLGFPITLIMGIVIIKIGMLSVGHQMMESIEHGLQLLTGMIR